MADEDHETAGEVFAEALQRWREAISRDPDASSARRVPHGGRASGGEASAETEDDEPGSAD